MQMGLPKSLLCSEQVPQPDLYGSPGPLLRAVPVPVTVLVTHHSALQAV